MNPILRAAFCSICSTYGHYIEECTDYTAILHRTPQFVEQLIPFQVKKFYNITSRTPIQNSSKKTEYVDIINTSVSIKLALEERGLPVLTNNIENKKRLERWAIDNGKKIMYHKKNEEKDDAKEPAKEAKKNKKERG